MTEEVDTAPAASVETAPAQASAPPPAATGGEQTPAANTGGDGPAFSVPEEYKGKGWAAKVKTLDDVWKQLDNLDSLAGKKVVAPIDYEKATPEEIEAYHAKIRPSDLSAYKFGEQADPAFSGEVAKVFAEVGLNAWQGSKLAEKVNSIAAKMVEARQASETDFNGYVELIKPRFGENYKETAAAVEATIKSTAKPEDAALFDNMDNRTRAAVDWIVFNQAKQYEERIQKILKDHGINESGVQGEAGPGGRIMPDKVAQRAAIRQQMRELDSRPHTQAEKEALQTRLNALL